MSRIAYLIGIPGSGKTEVAKRLIEKYGGEIDVIAGDHLLHWSAVRLCPYIKPGHNWDWGLWESLTRNCDLRSAFRRTILDLSNVKALPSPAPGKLLLAEATILGLSRLRDQFQEALDDAGFFIAASRVFWLKVPPVTIWERVRERNRENERWIDMGEVERRHRQYMDCETKAEFHSHDSDEIASAIREFLLAPS